MNVRLIDTSIMLNLLEVPNRCSDKDAVREEWRECLKNKDFLILPIATVIETGNHIAHISNGNTRRQIAGKFADCLKKTANNETPWRLYSQKTDGNWLMYFAERLEESAVREIGIGDLSIIYDYERYKEETPAIGTIMIWSTDEHLKAYKEENVNIRRRRKR